MFVHGRKCFSIVIKRKIDDTFAIKSVDNHDKSKLKIYISKLRNNIITLFFFFIKRTQSIKLRGKSFVELKLNILNEKFKLIIAFGTL